MLGSGRQDLLDFAVSLQARIDDLHRAVDEVATGLSRVDRRVDGSVTNTAVVRYDAYEGTGGQQSASMALLDSTRTGTVVTAIQGRDYARIYVKDLDRGRSSVAALAGGAGGGRAGDGPLALRSSQDFRWGSEARVCSSSFRRPTRSRAQFRALAAT